MVLQDYLTHEGHEMPSDTHSFLERVVIKLLNILNDKGINTKECEFLGTNDILSFRGKNIIIFSFSRTTSLLRPVTGEFPLSEIIATESSINIDRPELFESKELSNYLCTEHRCISTVNIAFPISYLSLTVEELKDAHNKVAEILVHPTEEDIDRKRRIVRVNPIYRGRDYLIETDLCFVLMEFKKPYTGIYDHLIKPTVESEGFRCIKSDDIFSTTSVIEDIWANINKANLIIAEISSNNPNVMYELGICHTVGKNVMMITQYPDKIPFNFRHMRCYPYRNDIPGSDELKRNIKSLIQHIKSTQI